jgi:sugar lactone lactonase YvrE
MPLNKLLRYIGGTSHPHIPDGICLDSKDGIWVADPANHCVVRVLEGGEVTDTIDTGRAAFACLLGGEDRKRLFICTAPGSGSAAASTRDGCIEYIDVEVAGAGWP